MTLRRERKNCFVGSGAGGECISDEGPPRIESKEVTLMGFLCLSYDALTVTENGK